MSPKISKATPENRISKTNVDALVCPPGMDRKILWDDKLKGFGVVAFPKGVKTYVVQYRADGRSHRVKLGKHGTLTAEQARKKATVLLGGVAGGEDPAEERREKRKAPTLAEVAEKYLSYVRVKKKPGTVRGYERALRLHILPSLGSRRITDIQHADVEKLHVGMCAHQPQANRTIAVLSAVWTFAAKHKHVSADSNPVREVEHYTEDPRERYLTKEEFARLGDAFTEAETIGLPYSVDEDGPKAKHAPKPENRRRKIDPYALAAIRLLMLTGARLREVLDAKWEYVDLERGMVFLRDSKTGKKPIYLSGAAAEIIASLPRLSDNPYLFPGEKKGRPKADLKKPWAAICEAAKLEGVHLHDLRHSFASIGVGGSLGLPIIGKLLGHSHASTTQRYAHLDADPMRRAAEMIGSSIAAAMGAGQDDAAPLAVE